MKFQPGVTYITCPQCKGSGTLTKPVPEIEGARRIGRDLTRFALSVMIVIAMMAGIGIMAGVSNWEIARSSILAGLSMLFIGVIGGFVVLWILRKLTTSRCPGCRGGG